MKIETENAKKVYSSITMRRIHSKILRISNPGYSTCSCCDTPWSHVEGKSLYYSDSTGYFPICTLCFDDKSVRYSDLILYYTNHEYLPSGLSHSEKEYMCNSLFNETKTNLILRKKYVSHLSEEREKKIDSII